MNPYADNESDDDKTDEDVTDMIKPFRRERRVYVRANTTRARATMSKPTLPQHEIVDLAVFQDEDDQINDDECGYPRDYHSCVALKRIATALRFYSVLNILGSATDLQEFSNFVGEKYTMHCLINDYVHLLQQHEKQTKEIQTYLTETTNFFPVCNVESCAFTARHQTDENTQDEAEERETEQEEQEQQVRYSWSVGSECLVYSRAKKKWYKARIVDVYVDAQTKQEWLVVKYAESKRKKIQRLCKDIKPIVMLTAKTALDPILAFYKDTFDGLHFYLFHLFDAGLRTTTSGQSDDEQTQLQAPADKYYDAAFARINKLISERKHIIKTFGRFKTNTNSNKFSINAHQQQQQQQQENTFMDSVYQRLSAMKISTESMQKLQTFIQDEQFDTDALEIDMDLDSGNIAQSVNDQHCTNAVLHILQSAKASSGSFSVGLRFYYWPWFKARSETKEHWSNPLDHSGYKVQQLFINRKYQSFKEELIEYGHEFNVRKYNEKVLVKSKALMQSNKVKVMKAEWDEYGSEPSLAHYGIARGAVIGFHHIVAVVLYTDYSALSADFSSTFRKSHPFEILDSIKRRNSVYWWWSKTLREAVELYGQSYYNTQYDENRKENKNKFEGPFYCGMSVVLNMPQFLIRLNVPTSTSMYVEVARHFSKENGIIIQLNNTMDTTKMQKGLNCAFISRYREEAERFVARCFVFSCFCVIVCCVFVHEIHSLFFGGYWPIKIESILLMKTNRNLQSVMSALSALDTVISGGIVREKYGEMHSLLAELFACYLGGESKLKFDEYIMNTFKYYVQHKEIINLNTHRLHTQWSNQDMVKLVMNGLEEQCLLDDLETDSDSEDEQEAEKKEASVDLRVCAREQDAVNLLQSSVFSLFPNVHTLNIITTDDEGRYILPFSFLSLLSLIQDSKIHKVCIKADVDKYGLTKCGKGKSWLDVWFQDEEYDEDRRKIEEQFKSQNFVIETPKSVQVAGMLGDGKQTHCIILRCIQ